MIMRQRLEELEAVELWEDMDVFFVQERYEETGIAVECEDGKPATLVC